MYTNSYDRKSIVHIYLSRRNDLFQVNFMSQQCCKHHLSKAFLFTGREQKGSGLAMDENDSNPHCIIPTEGKKQKRCVLCQSRKVRTRSGWEVLTQNRCSRCLVPLCTGVRNCFTLYHSFKDMHASLQLRKDNNDHSHSSSNM